MFSQKIQKGLKKRYRKEMVFKYAGMLTISIAMAFLLILFSAIIYRGTPAFTTHKVAIEVNLEADTDAQNIDSIDYSQLIKDALKEKFPSVIDAQEKLSLYRLISKNADVEIKEQLQKKPNLLGKKSIFWLSVSSDADMFFKGKTLESTPEESRTLKDSQLSWLKTFQVEKAVASDFNWNFLRYADSSEPELAGMAASIIGSFLIIIVFLLAAFPIGVMAAFYLEEFAKKHIITDIVEVSINNLAAIPSIIFGLLGLVVYLNFMHLPRSSAIVGGLTLSMLVLPIIIISTRNSIKTIPSSIKEAAVAMGASKVQVMFHHTLPLALPGIMTGTILAVSRALGETAPLLMIGMVAFIADVPHGFMEPATAMPVQIYLWSDSPELGFAERSAAAIMVLLMFLVFFNGIAVYIRKKFEKKW